MSLSGLLSSVAWAQLSAEFSARDDLMDQITGGCHKVAIWAHELGFANPSNPALPFLREMQASMTYVPACMSVALYKPAASSMRAALENALYFSYFKDHHKELGTLVNDSKYYISKSKIIEYHGTHCRNFKLGESLLSFNSKLEQWYSNISAVIHGQIPGRWTSLSLHDVKHDNGTMKSVLDSFDELVYLINSLFLITVDDEEWEGMSSDSRKLFLKGIPGEKKKGLGRAFV